MSEFLEESASGEAFEDAAAAIERACGRPEWICLGTFAAALLVRPDGSELAVSTGESLVQGWADRAGGSQAASRELRGAVRAWLDAADSAD